MERKKTFRISTAFMLAVGLFGLNSWAQTPYPEGPGPVIEINGKKVNDIKSSTSESVNEGIGPVTSIDGKSVDEIPVIQGPGPVTSVDGKNVNEIPIPQGTGPVTAIDGKNVNEIPIPQGTGPVTAIDGKNINEIPIPQGPGPVTSINGQSVNEIPLPQGPGPVVAESSQNSIATPPPPGWAGPGFLGASPSADWQNQGTINVMATGYDSQGVEKQIPLFVQYQFNGVNYNVTVLNAWNPYTYSWDANVDQPAYQTSYFFNGFTYNYYTVLSTGTFYFNL